MGKTYRSYFFSFIFHPSGESEASICGVSRGLQSFTMAAPLHALQIKASDSCKIQVLSILVAKAGKRRQLVRPLKPVQLEFLQAMEVNPKVFICPCKGKNKFT